MRIQNKQRYLIRYLSIFALLISIVIAKTSCKKNDLLTNENSTQLNVRINQFFNLPSNVNPAIARVAKELERQNQKTGFISTLATQAGFPVWDKSSVKLINNNSTNSNSLLEDYKGADTCILIPMVLIDANHVNAFISATIIDDSVTMRIYYRNDYKAYPFAASQTGPTIGANTTTAEEFAGQMMAFDNDIFGYTDFEVKDKRLFKYNTMYADSAIVIKNIKLISTNGSSNNLLPACIEFEYEVTGTYCGTPLFCVPQGYCDLCGTYCYLYSQTVIITVCSGGNPNGGGGTGTTGWPTAPPPGPGGTGGGSPGGGNGNPNGNCQVGALIEEGFAPPNPCNPPTGGNPLPPLSGNLLWLKNNLPLDPNQVSWLLQRPSRTNEIYDYLELETTPERKQIAKDHLELMRSDENYKLFVENHALTGNPNKIWWEDDLWLDNPTNFNLDITRANNQLQQLTPDEKALIAAYPLQAYIIKLNVQPAFDMTTVRMGSTGGLNDKKDAFRHAYFNAINTRDVPGSGFPTFVPGSTIVLLFANAHESQVPISLNLEKQMDLYNNNIGIAYGSTITYSTSNIAVANAIQINLLNGILRYLSPLDWINYSSTNGINPSTVLKPTNQ